MDVYNVTPTQLYCPNCGYMEDDNVLISYDTYYVRTQKRDKEYEYGMSEKQNIDGKRMRTSMYARRYVE